MPENVQFFKGRAKKSRDREKTALNYTTLKNSALPIFEVFTRILLDVNLFLNQTLQAFWLYLRQRLLIPLIPANFMGGVIFL